MPVGHTLSHSKRLSLSELQGERLVIGRSVAHISQISALNAVDAGTDVALFAMLISTGAVGLCTASIACLMPRELIARPLAGEDNFVEIYLLHPKGTTPKPTDSEA